MSDNELEMTTTGRQWNRLGPVENEKDRFIKLERYIRNKEWAHPKVIAKAFRK